jgi:predicted transcriptional regulator
MLVGWFLYTAAQSSYQQASLQETLSGVKVKDVMTKNIVMLNSSITVDEAVNGYFLKYGYGGFPVLEDGRFLGIITLKEVRDVPREDWVKVKVLNILIPRNREWEVSSEDDTLKALELMIMKDKGRLAVTDNDKIIGLITRNGIARYIQIMEK